MKKRLFTIATLFVAAAISVAVVSCQKDKETENENQTMVKSSNDDAKELLNRIYAFQSLRDDINSGAKSGESMTLDELRDNIDLTFNFEHSQHATPFDYATLDTFYVKMPDVDANGNVTAAEAIATYNAFETNLENLMANVDDDSDLAKNFSIKFPEAGAKSGDDIEVVFTRGERKDPSAESDPFEEGDDYIWGKMLGYCDPQPTARDTDAANELTRIFQFTPDEEHEGMIGIIHDIEYVGYKSYEDPENRFHRHIYYNDTTLKCGHRWLFYYSSYGTDEPCVMYDEMNCYSRSNDRIFVSADGDLHWGLYSGSTYHECIIRWVEFIDDDGLIHKLHLADVIYAKITWGSHE